MRFSKKVAVVTGGAGGIGAAVARSFAAEGAHVLVTDVRGDAARKIAEEINRSGGIAVGEQLDVRSYADVERIVQQTVKSYGGVNVAVNCAGILSIDRFESITENAWDNVMDVNAKGTFFFCKAVAQQMIRQAVGGKIINVSSVAGKIGVPMYTHYCASKFAVLGITKSLAMELAEHRINVNAVCPGDVETDMLDYEVRTHAQIMGVSVDDIRKEFQTRAPLGRLAQPSDVANVILFLASDAADYMTGQALNVSGGRMTS